MQGLGYAGVTVSSPAFPLACTLSKEGSYYKVYTSSGVLNSSSSYFSTAWSNAKGLLNSDRVQPEKISIKGDSALSVDAVCTFPSNINLYLDGAFLKLANGVNDNMFENDSPDTLNSNVIFDGVGTFDGNVNNNNAGNCVYFKNTDPIANLHDWIVFRGKLKFMNGRVNCIFIDNDSGSMLQAGYIWVEDILTEGSWQSGVRLKNINDAHIRNCHLGTGGSSGGLKLNNVSSVYISGGYFNQGIDVDGSGWGVLTGGWRVDCTSARHGIDLKGVQRWCISNGNINTYNGAGSGYAGINLSTSGGIHCTDNLFTNISLSHPTAGNNYTYGIQEADSNQNYNTYGVLNGRHCLTAGLRTLGANSKYLSTLIQGAVVTV